MQSDPNNPWNSLAQATVQSAWDRGQARLESIGLTLATLLEETVARTLRRFTRAGVQPAADMFVDALKRVALDDLGLAVAWERGNQRAWELYDEEFKSVVMSASIQQGFAPAAAEELASGLPGALLTAEAEGLASSLARYDGSGSLRGWLCTIARRRSVDGIRGLQRREELHETGLASEQPGPRTSAELREREERLHAVGERLRDSMSSRERLALLLKHEQGLSQREVATRMGVSDSRVTRLLQHAGEKLREGLLHEFGPQAAQDLQASEALLHVLGSNGMPPSSEPEQDAQ